MTDTRTENHTRPIADDDVLLEAEIMARLVAEARNHAGTLAQQQIDALLAAPRCEASPSLAR